MLSNNYNECPVAWLLVKAALKNIIDNPRFTSIHSVIVQSYASSKKNEVMTGPQSSDCSSILTVMSLQFKHLDSQLVIMITASHVT